MRKLLETTSRVLTQTRDPQQLRRAMEEAAAAGVLPTTSAMIAAEDALHELQVQRKAEQQRNQHGTVLPPAPSTSVEDVNIFDEVEANGSSDFGFCIVAFSSFALLTNKWLMEAVLRTTTLCLAVAVRGAPHGRLFTFTSGGFHGYDADSSREASVRVFTDAATNGLRTIQAMLDYLRLRVQVNGDCCSA